MLKKTIKFKINAERCKACGLCLEYCPKGSLQYSDSYNSMGIHPIEIVSNHNCSGCAFCAMVCPDAAIQVYAEEAQDVRAAEVSLNG